MEKYRFKEFEAESLADFLLPMLEWYPERRAKAKDMIHHPWLSMESNYDYMLTERDYQVMMLKNKLSNDEPVEDNKEMSELGESDIDLFNADLEDNDESIMLEDGDSLLDDNNKENVPLEDPQEEDIESKLPGPNYLNNSFTGPYPEDMSRPYVDKGPNPQFLEI
jgi:serine/threonine protein kinase